MATFGPEVFLAKNGTRLIIRHCEPSDAGAFALLGEQVASETTHTLQVVGRVSDIDKHATAFDSCKNKPRGLRLGVFAQHRMVAWLGFYASSEAPHPWTSHVAFFGCFVAQEFWGNGICRRLIEIMEQHAGRIGVSRIEARVRTQNLRGIKLYTRMGYEIEGTCRKAALVSGEAQDEHVIAKLFSTEPAWVPPELETRRTLLRPLRLSDAPHIFEYAKNLNVCRYVTWSPHVSVADSESFILDYAFQCYRKHSPEPWGITLRSKPDVVVGTVGCPIVSKNHRTMELAYALAEPLWGQGLVAECSRKVLDFCFAHYEVTRIQSRCMTANRASARVMEKLGMTYEGTLKGSFVLRGESIDLHYYAVLRSEWDVAPKTPGIHLS